MRKSLKGGKRNLNGLLLIHFSTLRDYTTNDMGGPWCAASALFEPGPGPACSRQVGLKNLSYNICAAWSGWVAHPVRLRHEIQGMSLSKTQI